METSKVSLRIELSWMVKITKIYYIKEGIGTIYKFILSFTRESTISLKILSQIVFKFSNSLC